MSRNYSVPTANKEAIIQGALIVGTRDETNGEKLGGWCVGIVNNGAVFAHSTEKVTIPDTFSGGGGDAKVLSTRRTATFNGSIFSLRKEIIQRLLHAGVTEVAGGSVAASAEVINIPANSGGLIQALAHPNISAVTFTGPGGTPTYDLDTDYTLNTEWGSFNIVAGGALDDASPLVLHPAYTYGAYAKVSAMTVNPTDLWARIEGVNVANSNSPILFDIHKVSVDILEQLLVIASEPAQPSFSFTMLADGFRPSSPYYDLIDAGNDNL